MIVQPDRTTPERTGGLRPALLAAAASLLIGLLPATAAAEDNLLSDSGLFVLADTVAAKADFEDAELAELRGGFVAIGGIEVNFGYELNTMINDALALRSVLTLDQLLGGDFSRTLGSATVGDLATTINHQVNGGAIAATVTNTQNDINISNIAKITIDVVGINRVRRGTLSGSGRPMDRNLRQAISGSISR